MKQEQRLISTKSKVKQKLQNGQDIREIGRLVGWLVGRPPYKMKDHHQRHDVDVDDDDDCLSIVIA